jgi:hypothetical protein
LLGIGLSYTDVRTSAAAAGPMIVGSFWACAVSMLWPERVPQPRPPQVQPKLQYGVLLGLAGATAAAGGTSGRRWYIAPAFTTSLVFLMLLYAEPENAAHRFNERMLETMLGVGLAYFYGLAVPKLFAQWRARRDGVT